MKKSSDARLRNPGALSAGLSHFAAVMSLITAGAYLAAEHTYIGGVKDTLFAFTLSAATIFLVFAETRMRRHMLDAGTRFFIYTSAARNGCDPGEEISTLYSSVWGSRDRTILGIIYGTAIGAGGYFISPWENQTQINYCLPVFLFFVNFVTGSALMSLLKFFVRLPWLERKMTVDIWNLKNPATEYVIDATRLIGTYGAIYVAICVISMIFSQFTFDRILIAYGTVCVAIVGASVFVPYLRIARIASSQKGYLQSRIGYEISHLTREFMLRHDNQPRLPTDVCKQLQDMLSVKDRIDQLSIIPFRTKATTSIISVSFAAFSPMLIESVVIGSVL